MSMGTAEDFAEEPFSPDVVPLTLMMAAVLSFHYIALGARRATSCGRSEACLGPCECAFGTSFKRLRGSAEMAVLDPRWRRR